MTTGPLLRAVLTCVHLWTKVLNAKLSRLNLNPISYSREFETPMKHFGGKPMTAEKSHFDRPHTVPQSARWHDADQEWELGYVDENGAKQGPFTYWRADGTLVNQCHFINNTAHGIFLRYHENGQISQRGAFDNGTIIGDRIYLRSVDKTTENFPRVDERVHKVVFTYAAGQISKQTFFSETGAELLPNGDEMPIRPAGIPEASHYSPSLKLWEHGELFRETDTAKPVKQGLWRYWNTAGKLVQETNYQRDKKHGDEKLFDPETGSVTEDNKYEMGEECGLRKREFQAGYFAFVGDWMGHGEVRGPRQVGHWDFQSENAKFQFDFGAECNASELIEAKLFDFDDRETWTFESLINKAEAFALERKFALALFCQVRAASEFENRGHLWAFLRAYSLPLSFGAAYEDAASCGKIWSRMPFNHDDVERSSAVYLLMYLDQIVRGAAPEKMLQQAAIYFDINGCHRLAQLLIKGTLLLAPERADFAFNAGLIAMSLGDIDHAKACATTTLKSEPKMGLHLQNYIDIAFVSAELDLPSARTFGFTFEKSPFGSHDVVLRRELTEIRNKVASSLGWLTVLREIALEKVEPKLKADPNSIFWLPKDFAELVGPEVMEEQRQHRHRVEGLALPDLLSEVRMMSRFVATLCWSIGMSQIGLPEKIEPQPALGAWAPEAYARSLFLEDLENQGHTKVPEFEFQGKAVSQWPVQFHSFIKSETRGFTGAIQFLFAEEDSEEPPIPFSLFEKFYDGETAA